MMRPRCSIEQPSSSPTWIPTRCFLAGLVAVLLVSTVTIGVVDAITLKTYSTATCTGSATSTAHYSSGACNLGGVVYSCLSGQQCLVINTVELNGTAATANRRSKKGSEPSAAAGDDDSSCGGTVTSTTSWVCDQCVGGADAGVSTTVTGCSGDHPKILTCMDGNCGSGGRCYNDSGNITLGCIINGTHGIDISVVSCSAVSIADYSNYQDCSGSINSQSWYPAGRCMGYDFWSC